MFDPALHLRDHSRTVDALLEVQWPPPVDGEPFEEDYLTEAVRYQFASGGKRLRPALCLLTCEALGGEPVKAQPFALATELLHNFFLIHDDIEDGDEMRRDRPTLWVAYGVPNAINVSDAIISRAYRLILESDLDDATCVALTRAYSFAFERTVEGQALDINLRGHPEVDLATYYRIVTHKTAYYLALTWVGGAMVAGVPPADLELFWELGKCLGPAFQIRDDLIDMTHGKGRGGEVGCDIREGKPSIFYAYVLEKRPGTEADRERLVEILRRTREETTEEDVRWAIDFFTQSGAIDFAEAEARRLVAEAEGILDRLPLDGDGKEKFRAIARFIIERNM